MNIRKPHQHHIQHIPAPSIRRPSRERLQRHQHREHIHLAEEYNHITVVDFFGYPSPYDQLSDEERPGWDGEKICLEGIEFQTAEDESKIGCCGVVGNGPGEAEDIDGPHIIIFESGPEEGRGYGLSGLRQMGNRNGGGESSLLCMSPFDGSSRMMRFARMICGC